MAFRNKIYLIICGIVAQLLFFGDIRADELRPRDNATEQEISTAPEHHDMTLVSSQPWVVEGEVLGTLAAYVYSDVTTEKPVDYWELYDKQTNLLAAIVTALINFTQSFYLFGSPVPLSFANRVFDHVDGGVILIGGGFIT